MGEQHPVSRRRSTRPDVWSTRDFPVLVEVARRIDAGDETVLIQEVTNALGMPVGEVRRAGAALARRHLVSVDGVAEDPVLWFTDVAGSAYSMTGLHPSDDLGERLLAALDRAIENASEPEKMGRLRGLRSAAGELGKEALGGLVVAVLTGQLPGMGG